MTQSAQFGSFSTSEDKKPGQERHKSAKRRSDHDDLESSTVLRLTACAVTEPATEPSLDALPPADMAKRAEEIGVKKARQSALTLFILAILAGAFIALGGMFSLVASADSHLLPFGIGRLVAGLAFSLGLILVLVGGAELFTGNNLIVMAWASRRIATTELVRNWSIVYVGNFVGAVLTAALIAASGAAHLGQGRVALALHALATSKMSHSFGHAVGLGVLCNALVCLAVWLSMSARSSTDRILSIIFPVTAFVACGFEHSIANMFFLPLQAMTGDDASLWISMWWSNLIPVTLGNVIGGGMLVGGVYWLAYLRGARN